MSQNQTKEIKQYKDFTTITNIRKITQEAINPLIKSVEQQMSTIMFETTQLKKRSAKIDEVLKTQKFMDQRITDTKEMIRSLKDTLAGRHKDQDKKHNRQENANEKIFLEINELKTLIKTQDQVINQMKKKNDKMANVYTTLEAKAESNVKDIQEKFSKFMKEILDLNRSIKLEYNENKSTMEVLQKSFKRERGEMEDKFIAIKLYFEERQIMNKKIQDIYSRMLTFVHKDDFEGFRLSQIKLFEQTVEKFQNKILQILPPSIQKILPQAEKRLKEVDRIPGIESKLKETEEKTKKIQKQIKLNKETLTKQLQTLNDKVQTQHSEFSEMVKTKFEVIEESIKETNTNFDEKLLNLQEKMHEEVKEEVERGTSQVYKTIEEEQNSKKNSIDFSKQEELAQEVEQIKKIKDKLLSRYKKIEEVGSTIDHKIESYSSRITKIKSDYQLFSENMRREMRQTIKFKSEFIHRLSDIGSVLASFGEMMLINGSFLLQEKLERETGTEVFVTNNDGIIYEWKGSKNKLTYRKNKVDPKEFAKSYMFSMVTYIDDVFAKYPFLNWFEHKPSQFFLERILANYYLHLNRSKTANNQNEHDELFMENQKKEKKQFSRTIDSKHKPQIQLVDNANITEVKRTYSIKRHHRGGDKGRYEQGFLTSRSGCRSRISQVL